MFFSGYSGYLHHSDLLILYIVNLHCAENCIKPQTHTLTPRTLTGYIKWGSNERIHLAQIRSTLFHRVNLSFLSTVPSGSSVSRHAQSVIHQRTSVYLAYKVHFYSEAQHQQSRQWTEKTMIILHMLIWVFVDRILHTVRFLATWVWEDIGMDPESWDFQSVSDVRKPFSLRGAITFSVFYLFSNNNCSCIFFSKVGSLYVTLAWSWRPN